MLLLLLQPIAETTTAVNGDGKSIQCYYNDDGNGNGKSIQCYYYYCNGRFFQMVNTTTGKTVVVYLETIGKSIISGISNTTTACTVVDRMMKQQVILLFLMLSGFCR